MDSWMLLTVWHPWILLLPYIRYITIVSVNAVIQNPIPNIEKWSSRCILQQRIATSNKSLTNIKQERINVHKTGCTIRNKTKNQEITSKLVDLIDSKILALERSTRVPCFNCCPIWCTSAADGSKNKGGKHR